MSQFFRLLLVGMLGLPLWSHAADGTPMKFEIEGVTRHALVFEPPARKGDRKIPVVLAFHGHGGNMQGFARKLALHDRWPEALVVYPQGLPTESPLDKAGRKPGWQREAGQNGGRDLKLVDAILAWARLKYAVDVRRVYATGFSNGGGFSLLLWAERPQSFAAFAVCAGPLSDETRLSAPKPLLYVGGRKDPLVTPARQQAALAAARRADGKAAPVEFVAHPGGHVVPDWAGARIAAFFKRN